MKIILKLKSEKSSILNKYLSSTLSLPENPCKIITKEGSSVIVDKNYLLLNQYFKDLLQEDDESDMEDDDKSIPEIKLETIDLKTLKLVIEFGEHHLKHEEDTQMIRDLQKPLVGPISNSISEFDKKFLDKMDQSQLISIITASNFLNNKPLLDLGCAMVASMIKGKSTDQIRGMFGIENDFTPEEDEEIKKQNRWCE